MLVLGTTACTSSSSSGFEHTQAPAPKLSNEDLYLQSLQASGNSYVFAATDSQLIELGYTVCSALDDGNSILDIVTYLALNSNNDDPEFSRFEGQVIGAAVASFCPEYSGQINAL